MNPKTPGVAEGTLPSSEPARRPLDTGFIDAEAGFYDAYPWCLNAFPTLREVVGLLTTELGRVERVGEGWQRAEVMTNVFLLSCAIADTVDDYMLGDRFDFSQAAAALPALGPGLRAADALARSLRRAREWRLGRVPAWRTAWGSAVVAFLKVLVDGGSPDRDALAQARARLASLLGADLPAGLARCRPRIPSAFRTEDLTHVDILALGRRFTAAFPDRARPALVVGLRTAGSYFAPLLCAALSVEGYRDPECITVRPKKGLGRWEGEALARSAGKGGIAIIVDEPPNTAATLAQGVDFVRKAGYAPGDIAVLLPVHPAGRGWASGQGFLALSGIRILTLEPEQWHKCRLLEPAAAEARLAEYFARRRYAGARVMTGPAVERMNTVLERRSNDPWHNRLKRIYEVRLDGDGGRTETRYVLAKSVGWGWLGYHAALAGERLSAFVPPLLGLRDGILYTEWLPQGDPAKAESDASVQRASRTPLNDDAGGNAATAADRERWQDAAASYVAARVRGLPMAEDPSVDLVRTGQDKGFDVLSGALAGAYGSKAAAVLKRARLRQTLASRPNPVPTLIDGKMRRQEWITGPGPLLKTDFEHHGQGKHQLNVADPAYDLAETMLSLGPSEAEEGRLIDRYIDQSGDAHVRERLFLHKLLAGTCAAKEAVTSLADPALSDRGREFNQLYIDAWNFLTVHTARLCGRISGRPAALRWSSPLVVMDIDGVLDTSIFGFPSASAAGVCALSLLHAHNSPIAVDTARPLSQVKEYSRAYGFVGAVAEYGAVVWDAVDGGERILVSPESLQQLEDVRSALRRVPGVFLNEDLRYSIRAYTFERGMTVSLPTLLVRDVIAGLHADRLGFVQTYLDTAIVPREVDKGKGLLALLDLAGRRGIETAAIGDGEPDLAMFRVAGRSFAPAHIPCRAAAKLLGCRIARRPYQMGLLESVRAMLHPDGGGCDRCRSGGRLRTGEADRLVWDLLKAADRGRPRLLLQALLDPMALRAFIR
ncbi:MAG TPA: HAD hydrolase family protein [bacterium]|nr:HAD hydrolase family protein [bacterium]